MDCTTSASSSTATYSSDCFWPAYNVYSTKRDDDIDPYAWFNMKAKIEELRESWLDVRLAMESKFKLMIVLMTNVFAATFYRRASFSKSGFIGRTAKRRKGRG
jgi:hypothetical protein